MRTFRDITGESPRALRERERAAQHDPARVPPCIVSTARRPDIPPYFRVELAWAKLAGVVVLLAPVPARLKEWAYAGFAFTLAWAWLAHLPFPFALQQLPKVELTHGGDGRFPRALGAEAPQPSVLSRAQGAFDQGAARALEQLFARDLIVELSRGDAFIV